jgi:hypothetical protein
MFRKNKATPSKRDQMPFLVVKIARLLTDLIVKLTPLAIRVETLEAYNVMYRLLTPERMRIVVYLDTMRSYCNYLRRQTPESSKDLFSPSEGQRIDRLLLHIHKDCKDVALTITQCEQRQVNKQYDEHDRECELATVPAVASIGARLEAISMATRVLGGHLIETSSKQLRPANLKFPMGSEPLLEAMWDAAYAALTYLASSKSDWKEVRQHFGAWGLGLFDDPLPLDEYYTRASADATTRELIFDQLCTVIYESGKS